MADEPNIEDVQLKGGGTPKLLLIVLLVNLAATGAVAAKVMTFSPVPPPAAAEAPAVDPEAPGPVHPMESFIVNLNETAGSRFLKITLELEVVDEETVTLLIDKTRVVRDSLLTYLSGLSVEDTMGEQAKITIKNEIAKRLNELLAAGEEPPQERVKRVFFSEFVVQ